YNAPISLFTVPGRLRNALVKRFCVTGTVVAYGFSLMSPKSSSLLHPAKPIARQDTSKGNLYNLKAFFIFRLFFCLETKTDVQAIASYWWQLASFVECISILEF